MAVNNSAPFHIVRAKGYAYFIAGHYFDPVAAHFAGNVGQHFLIGIDEFDSEQCVRQILDDYAFELNALFLCAFTGFLFGRSTSTSTKLSCHITCFFTLPPMLK